MADLDELRTFLTAVHTGSFARAGRQLNLSPAMVGRRIQSLERRYSIKLIERTTRAQRLTEAGQDFLVHATKVIEAVDALAEISGAATLRGRIRLSAPTTVGIRLLPPIVARFSAQHPEVIFEMSLSDRRVDLVTEGFDLAVRIGELPASSLITRRIGTYHFACCAAPDFLIRHDMPRHPAELERTRCILNLNLVPRNRWLFYGPEGTPLTVEVGSTIEIDNGEAQRAMAIDGAGIAYLPLDLVATDLAEGRLIEVLEDWTLMTLPIHIVRPSRDLVPKRTLAFIDALALEFRDMGLAFHS